jgi:Lysylphosphatidylglycerol synthase TM region
VRRRLFFTCGALLLGFLVWRLGLAEIAVQLREIGWHALPILFIYAVYELTRAAALKLCVIAPRRLRFRDALWIRLSGEAVVSLTFTGPFLSEPTKAWLLERRGLTLTEGFAATLSDYLAATFVGAAMCIGGLLYLWRHAPLRPPWAGAALALVIAMLAFLAAAAAAIVERYYLIGAVLGWLARAGIFRTRIESARGAIAHMEDLLLGVLHDRPARFAGVLALESAGHALLVAEVYWVFHALALGAPPIDPLVVEAATKSIGLVFFFMPLQVGSAEAGYALVFAALGLPATAGFSLAFVRRLRSLLVASIGFAALNRLTGHAA